jgi:tetratricopeptide (TPR) repeat protein
LRGHAFEILGEYEEARAQLERAVEISRQLGDTDEEWQALIDLGMAWAERDYSQAGHYYKEALTLAERLHDNVKLAHSLNRLGNWHANVGRHHDALQAHERALAIFERLDDTDGRAQTLDFLGLVSYLSGDVRASAAYNRSAAALFDDLGDLRGSASTLAIMAASGGGLTSEGVPVDTDASENWRAYAEQSLAAARQTGWRAGEAFALLTVALAAGVRGEYRLALQHAAAARDLSERIEHRQWLTGSMYTLGHLRFDLLEYEAAEPLLRGAHQLAASIGSEYWTWSSASTLSALLRERSELEEAWHVLACPMDVALDPHALVERRCWFQRGWLLTAAGDGEQAAWIAEELRARAGTDVSAAEVPELALLHATALRLSGRLEDAGNALDAARDGGTAHGYRPLLRRVELESVRLALATGERRAAERAAMRSHAVAVELADELDVPSDRQRYLLAALVEESRALAK